VRYERSETVTAEALERLAQLSREAADYAQATGEDAIARGLRAGAQAAAALAGRERANMAADDEAGSRRSLLTVVGQ
jgi:hypothetical protein